jgi:branched-chain amino acid aminotransferase
LIADEVFLSGTAAKITPVRQIEAYTLPTHRPVTDRLRHQLTVITEGRDPAYRDWNFVIPV